MLTANHFYQSYFTARGTDEQMAEMQCSRPAVKQDTVVFGPSVILCAWTKSSLIPAHFHRMRQDDRKAANQLVLSKLRNPLKIQIHVFFIKEKKKKKKALYQVQQQRI